jgi:hypothetical protein
MSGSSVYNTFDILCTGGVSYTLHISLLISKLCCTKDCALCRYWFGGGAVAISGSKKVSIFQGPLFPVALEMDLPASNSLRPVPYKQVH